MGPDTGKLHTLPRLFGLRVDRDDGTVVSDSGDAGPLSTRYDRRRRSAPPRLSADAHRGDGVRPVVVAAAWPFLDSLSPPETLGTAAAPVTLDLRTVAPGTQHVLAWNGHPVFAVHRTAAELAALRDAATDALLLDPRSHTPQQPDAARQLAPLAGAGIRGLCRRVHPSRLHPELRGDALSLPLPRLALRPGRGGCSRARRHG